MFTRSCRLLFRFSTKYSNEHEWVKLDASKTIAKVGITEYAQSELGDIVHIELPKIGMKFLKMNSVGAIEAVKVAADIYAPISGEVININDEVRENPALVNEAAEENWIFEAKVNDVTELEQLMTKEQYLEFVKSIKH